MIGIDVVDLTDPLLKPRSKNHLRFISHPKDRNPFASKLSDAENFWLFWSAKECIFKCYRKDITFDPKSIAVSVTENPLDNHYKFTTGKISGTVEMDIARVVAYCNHNSITECHKDFFRLTSNQSGSIEVRERIVNTLETNVGNPHVFTNDLMPTVKDTITNQNHIVSITHHNLLGGYIIAPQ